MKRRKLSTLAIFVVLLFASPIYAQKIAPQKADRSAKPDYILLMEKARAGEAVDYVKMRAAYLDWVNDECNQSEAPGRDEMVKAFEGKDWQNAVKLADKVLDYEFINRGLHLAMANAYKELKKPEREAFHNDLAKKLMQALLDSGDGKSAKTAYKVHSIREEYTIMRELGYQVSMQSLVFDKQYGSFDVLAGKDANGKEGSFYFDINSFFGGGKSKPCKK